MTVPWNVQLSIVVAISKVLIQSISTHIPGCFTPLGTTPVLGLFVLVGAVIKEVVGRVRHERLVADICE